MFVCMYECMYVCKNVCIYICIFLCMYICKNICIYVCMCVCMYVYMYVCVHERERETVSFPLWQKRQGQTVFAKWVLRSAASECSEVLQVKGRKKRREENFTMRNVIVQFVFIMRLERHLAIMVERRSAWWCSAQHTEFGMGVGGKNLRKCACTLLRAGFVWLRAGTGGRSNWSGSVLPGLHKLCAVHWMKWEAQWRKIRICEHRTTYTYIHCIGALWIFYSSAE